jgi:hypothetical protein
MAVINAEANRNAAVPQEPMRVDAIAQTIVVLRPDGTALYANQEMLNYAGLTMDDVLDTNFVNGSFTRRMRIGFAKNGSRRSYAASHLKTNKEHAVITENIAGHTCPEKLTLRMMLPPSIVGSSTITHEHSII